MPDAKDIFNSQNKPTTGTQGVLKKSLISNNFFKDNIYYSYLYKKTERLTSALHMVTNFIPANEPVRVRLRDKAISLVENVLALRQGNAPQVATVDAVIGAMIEIVSLLETAYAAGYITAMNGNLLREEYEKLADFIKAHRTDLSQAGDSLEEYVAAPPISEKVPQNASRARLTTSSTVPKEPSRIHNGRREAILQLLKDKEKITVKDAVSAAPGMSEKTIQRELSALVLEGKIIKEGNRRWSTYRISQGPGAH